MSEANVQSAPSSSAVPESEPPAKLSPQQWKSGIAAWLGWMFDGLDLHLYTLVAAPFVAELLGAASTTHPDVPRYSSIIQGAFLLGWALGGGLFGRIGDRLGRSRALSLTVLTYAAFTGLSFFAQTWWQLMIFRFLAALGIGGEWAVGASLLAETWPRKWRPWIAAVLQCGVNIGILAAILAHVILSHAQPPFDQPRYLFLVGIVPALLVFWIRRAVPETPEWHAAKVQARNHEPRLADLFHGDTRRITVWAVLVCGVSLAGHWAFLFWNQQHLRTLPEVLSLTDRQRHHLVDLSMFLIIGSSILGNFFSGWLARLIGYRATIAWMFVAYFLAMFGAYSVARGHEELLWWFPVIGFCQGVFGLFTMYLPPLFPTLLRTTGAGFCYNIGRICAAVATVFFGSGLFTTEAGRLVGDHRHALLYAGFLFLPAAAFCLRLPRVRD
jgi:MFS family permease